MSVSTGRPQPVLTRSSARRPSSSPGPRAEASLERLALSKEDLKSTGSRCRAERDASASPTAMFTSSPSSTQGPAMRKKFSNTAGVLQRATLPVTPLPDMGAMPA